MIDESSTISGKPEIGERPLRSFAAAAGRESQVRGARGDVLDTTSLVENPATKIIVPGTYVDEDGIGHPAYLKIFGNQASCLAESQVMVRVNERGVGPRIFETAGSDVLAGSRVALSAIPDLPHDADAVIFEDAGESLDRILAGKPIPRRDRTDAAGINPESLDLDERDRLFRKILFDLAWQLDAMLNREEAVYHGDIKLGNICVAAYGADPRDVRATIIDFETAATKRAGARRRGGTRTYRRLVPGCAHRPDAYDLGCCALVFWQISSGRMVNRRDEFSPARFSHTAMREIFRYREDGPGQWVPEAHPKELPRLVKQLAGYLCLTDAELECAAWADGGTRARITEMLHGRRWLDRRDLVSIPTALSREAIPSHPDGNGNARDGSRQPPPTRQIAIMASASCAEILTTTAAFLDYITRDTQRETSPVLWRVLDPSEGRYRRRQALAIVDTLLLLLDSPLGPEAETASDAMALLDEATDDTLQVIAFIDERVTDSESGGSPRGGSKGPAAQQLEELCDELATTPGCSVIGFSSTDAVMFHLGLLLGEVTPDEENDLVRIGSHQLGVESLPSFQNAVGDLALKVKRCRKRLEKAELACARQPDSPQASRRRDRAAEELSRAEAAYARERTGFFGALAKIQDVAGLSQTGAPGGMLAAALAELDRGDIASALEILGDGDFTDEYRELTTRADELTAVRRIVDAEQEALRVRAEDLVGRELARATAFSKMPISPERNRQILDACRIAALMENNRSFRSLKVTTDACEAYGHQLARLARKSTMGRKWLERALEGYRACREVDPALIDRRICRTLLLMAGRLSDRSERYRTSLEEILVEVDAILDRIEDDPRADAACRGSFSEDFHIDRARINALRFHAALEIRYGDVEKGRRLAQDALAACGMLDSDARVAERMRIHVAHTVADALIHEGDAAGAHAFLEEAALVLEAWIDAGAAAGLALTARYNQTRFTYSCQKLGKTEEHLYHQALAVKITRALPRFTQRPNLASVLRAAISALRSCQAIGVRNLGSWAGAAPAYPTSAPWDISDRIEWKACILNTELSRVNPDRALEEDLLNPLFHDAHIDIMRLQNDRRYLDALERAASYDTIGRNLFAAALDPIIPSDDEEVLRTARALANLLKLHAGLLRRRGHAQVRRATSIARERAEENLVQASALVDEAFYVLDLARERLEADPAPDPFAAAPDDEPSLKLDDALIEHERSRRAISLRYATDLCAKIGASLDDERRHIAEIRSEMGKRSRPVN